MCVFPKAEDVFWQQTDFCDKIFHSERKGLNVLDNSVGYRQLAEKSCMDLEIWALRNTTSTHYTITDTFR